MRLAMAFLHEAANCDRIASRRARLLRWVRLCAAPLVLSVAFEGVPAQADEIIEAPPMAYRPPAPPPNPEPAREVEPTPEPVPRVRIRGEVVETACFIIGNRTGEVHRQCAIASARAGQDLGILDEKTKTLYLAVVDHRAEGAANPLTPFIAHRVEAYGVLMEYGDLPALQITKVQSLRPPR